MGEYEGARWLRADLHVHSPFDATRRFGEDVARAVTSANAGNSTLLDAIADRFVDACIAAELDMVAITDHNSVEGIRRMANRISRRRNEAQDRGEVFPVVFPGVEITVGGERPIHFLVLVGPDEDVDRLDRLVANAFGPRDRFRENQPLSTNTTVDDFLKGLREFCEPPTGEREDVAYLVIPAHMDQDEGLGAETGAYAAGGLFDEMRGHVRQRAIVRSDWQGFEVRREFVRLPEALRNLICEWITRRAGRRWDELAPDEQATVRASQHWPLIMGSDPGTYADLGRRSTWLKMAIPSLEGIRLALLDPQSRLRSGSSPAPGANHPFIQRLKVSNADFIDELEVNFSPNLNAIIGGRGTGKSTLLEFMRFGLERLQEDDLPAGRVRETVERLLATKENRDFGQTAGMILPGTFVEMDVAVAGTVYRVRRDRDGITITDPQDWLTGDRLDIRALVAPRILSQGQIAEIARSAGAQLKELDATIPTAIRDFEGVAGELGADLERKQIEYRRLAAQLATLPALETELRTVRDKIAFLEQGDNQALLRRMAAFRAEQQWLTGALDVVKDRADAQDAEAQNSAEAAAALPAPPGDGPTAEWLNDVQTLVRTALTAASTEARQRQVELLAAGATIEREREERWVPTYRETSEAFAALQGQLRERDVQFAQHRQLIGRRLELETQVEGLRTVETRVATAIQAMEETWRALRSAHITRSEARQRAAGELRELDHDIRIEVVPFGDRGGLERLREEWFAGTGLQERDWDSILDYVFQTPIGTPERWHEITAALAADADAVSGGTRVLSAPSSQMAALLGHDRLTGHFYNAVARMTRQRVEASARFLMDDRIRTEVRDASGEFKPIEQGSLGQRATAVLSLLLAAGDQPLIVDQPEEDLDNSFIYEVVVDLLRDRKFSRQIIVATHNPNIPVNGDAEQIVTVAVAARLGTIDCAGSIDLPAVKQRVNEVLEGSVEAFRLRAQRYGF